ncbi:MAG: M1 family aminopeptidase [Desulfobacterales bacterium]
MAGKQKQTLAGRIHKIITVLTGLIFGIISGEAQVYAFNVSHRLFIELIPEEQKLTGIDHIRLESSPPDLLPFHLSEKSKINGVWINGQKTTFRFSGNMLHVPVKTSSIKPVEIRINYEAVFNDSVPELPANSDNPGFGVDGVISGKGCFLLSGSGWRPVMLNSQAAISLTVKAPEGMTAVTAGQRLGETHEGKHTISRWEIKHPVKGLSLSAGYFEVFEKQTDNAAIFAFFYPDNKHLANDYLNAASKYLTDYESLFGPYPFPKFAIVENFFPTGYGFASYTLIGSRVLQLPFIIDTSLGHEIAHCWWGNGVYPDYSRGNWSEGLTTYVAEHLFNEKRSAADARDHRLQMLRNYTTLINPSNDFPLADFTSRVNPATKVIGYDKGAMFFHMLRKEVGDDIFWDALREIFNRHLFKQASWSDFREIFETLSGKNLELFFDQWINREGAPQLALEDVHTQNSVSSNSRTVKGTVVQKPPFYHLSIPMLLETDTKDVLKTISLDGERTSFEFFIEEGIFEKLTADPDVDIFRKLHNTEIPPTINSLKASDSMLVVLADSLDFISNDIPQLLVQGLGINHYQIILEKDLHKQKVEKHDLLWFGLPSSQQSLAFLPEILSFESDVFFLNGISYFSDNDIFFGVFRHPDTPDRVAGLFVPLSSRNLAVTVRKISHYGKYSYLVFNQGQNTKKGIWPIEQSPLVFRFDNKDGGRL